MGEGMHIVSLEIRLPNGKTMSPTAAQLTLAISKKKIPRGTLVRDAGGEWVNVQEWVARLRAQRENPDGSVEAHVTRSSVEPLGSVPSDPAARDSAARLVTGTPVANLPDGLFVDLIEHPDHGLAAVVADFFVLRRAVLGGFAFSASILLGCLLGHQLGMTGFMGGLGAAFGLAFALAMTGWVNNPQNLIQGVIKACLAILLVAALVALINSVLASLFALIIGTVGGLGGAVGLVILNSLLSLVYMIIFLMLCVSSLVIATWLALNLIAGAAVDGDLIDDLKRALSQPRVMLEAGLPTLFGLTFSGFLVGLLYLAFSHFSDGAVAYSRQGVVDLEAGIQYLYGLKMSAGMGTLAGVPSGLALVSALILSALVALIAALIFAFPLLVMARATMVYLPVQRADLRVQRSASLPKPVVESDLPAYAPDPEEDEISPQERRSQEIAAAVDQVEIRTDLPPADDDGTLTISWGSDDDEVELETRGD